MNRPKLDTLNMPDDGLSLYNLMESQDQYLFSTKIHHNTYESFMRWLSVALTSTFHDFFVIRLPGKASPIGYAYSYDFSLRDGRCQVVVCTDFNYRKTGAGGFAAIDLLAFLFRAYPLRKIYATVYDYNKESLASNLSAGFIEEGLLREYRYYDGRYHSLHYLSIDRATFLRRYNDWGSEKNALPERL